MRLKQLWFLLVGIVGLLPFVGCGPPNEYALRACRIQALERSEGRGLTQADIGELTEACMSKSGFLLKRTGSKCSHDLTSQSNRLCYFPDNAFARAYSTLPEF